MKRLDIECKSAVRVTFELTTDSFIVTGSVEMHRYMDCLDDAVKAVYERLEEDGIKLVGKCEVYCNGKLWEVVDNG